MTESEQILPAKNIQERIFTIRGVQVILDTDLAEMYQVPTSRINEQVKRNLDRFPEDFMFQLTASEWQNLKSQNAISSWGGRRTRPYAFTEQGVSSLSGVLKSEVATRVYISIMRAFVEMRKFITQNAALFQRIENVEQKQLQSDVKIDQILNALENNTLKPKQGIFFDGQIFDAYSFVADLIKSAKQRIVLIDNYVDESVLTVLSKRKKNVAAIVFTSHITKQLQLDSQKHNQQYSPIELKEFSKSHDRFLIIDEVVYHFGASLKDLGKKWFAFSKMEMKAEEILGKLRI